MTYDTILVPTDGDADPGTAVDHAAALADRFDATLFVLYVVDLGVSRRAVDDDAWTTAYDDAESTGEAVLDDIAARVAARHPTVPVVRAVRQGNPAAVVLDAVATDDCDLVVMGPQRTARVLRLFVGSTTERVVRASPVPVLTVRSDGGGTTTAYDDVLVATDGSPGSWGAVEAAVELAEAFDATLHAVSVVERQYTRSPPLRAFAEREGCRALRRVIDTAATAGVTVEDRLLEGDPHETVVEYATDHGVDLVVVGTHGKTGLDRLVMGSVSAHVVRSAPMPVLTVRTVDDGDGS